MRKRSIAAKLMILTVFALAAPFAFGPEASGQPPQPTPSPGEPSGQPPQATPSPGDVSCDGSVNSIDATLILQFDAGILATLGCGENAEVSGDGAINSIDAALILQFDARLIDSLSLPPPSPTIVVSEEVQPATEELPGFDGGPPRRLGSVADTNGTQVDFSEDEVILVTDDPAELADFVTRWQGEILLTFDPAEEGLPELSQYHLVRINTDLAEMLTHTEPADIGANLRALHPSATGELRVSSRAALGLLAAWAAEAADGLLVGLNFVGTADDFGDRTTTEAPTGLDGNGNPLGGYTTNAYDWNFLNAGSTQDIGVTEAWRALELAGRLIPNQVDYAVWDEGFVPNADFPAGWTEIAIPPYVNATGTAGMGDAWHGTKVVGAGMGVPDNSFGGAGVAGPVAHLIIGQALSDIFSGVMTLPILAAAGADIINMSWSWDVPAVLTAGVLPFEIATAATAGAGVLLFASAGNDGENVDATDCIDVPVFKVLFFWLEEICWEETWHTPCENAGVICVGGLAQDSRNRAGGSNYGPEQVDIFAPYTVWVGPDPANPGNIAFQRNGTSYSSPYAAGVAALIWAADPNLSAGQVLAILYGTARSSPDPNVNRYVNAFGAVRQVLGNIPPFVRIDSPANGASVGYGGLNFVDFQATVDDYEDGDACCTVTWTSNPDGNLGGGTEISFVFPGPGIRVITATVTDSDGATNTDSIILTAAGDPPAVQIIHPEPGEVIFRNTSYLLQGTSWDINEPFQVLPCSSLTWTVSFPDVTGPFFPIEPSFPTTGCDPVVEFQALGLHRLTLTGTDSEGMTGTDTVDFLVQEVPANAPPIVTILNVADGYLLPPYEPFSLMGTATDPDEPITYEWRVRHDFSTTEVVIGTGANLSWTPSDHVPFDCGGHAAEIILYATDADGMTGSDSVDVMIAYPPC